MKSNTCCACGFIQPENPKPNEIFEKREMVTYFYNEKDLISIIICPKCGNIQKVL